MRTKTKIWLILIGIGLLFILILSFSTFTTIQPGHRGIMFRPWTTGLDTSKTLQEGLHLIAPWNKIFVYDIREQSIDFSDKAEEYASLDVLDKNGLTIHVEVTVRFSPYADKIGTIHERFGLKYISILVIPEVRSSVRKIMGHYTAEEIYSTKRQDVENEIIKETQHNLEINHIHMTALLIRSIQIPENLRRAIEDKLTKQQEALAYEFIVDKELKEKQRKIIQAEGIAEYNKLVNESMTDRVLSYEGIQATLQLAKSSNSKIVIIGNTKNGLPIMLSQ